ncbi:CpaF family protein [Candidatus Nephthysia bennettiae]|uniref:CpaF family protein n=1 Tax=Candidatus Nephthysia bennettiae TaxID=3127016 RepID=A0A934K729_9BACT|nr:CpaF family protein [Candidatus Dormibacteraeota bacterium]MBJ7611959.1 CpaF family protein [Candidatus Dormibacteraeota bacterium]
MPGPVVIPGVDIADYYDRLGPLKEPLLDDRVSEVMVNGKDQIFVEIEGRIAKTGLGFPDEESLVNAIQFIAGTVGRHVDERTPLVDCRLVDGSRVNAVLRPVAIDGPSLTIRKFATDPYQVEDLIRFGTCTESGFGFLKACVHARANIIVSGGTGTGKTTFLNVISSFIPERERIVTIEDAAELQLHQEHVVRLESRPRDIEGEGEIPIRRLVVNSLRMRPDRIVVGECRAGEALDMLQAMNTGHDGSMTTLHANTPREALGRLETLVLMGGIELPVRAIRGQIAGAVDIFCQLGRLRDGSRRVTSITEVDKMNDDVILTQEVFRFEPHGVDEQGRIAGDFVATGVRPIILDRLVDSGLPIPQELLLLFPDPRGSFFSGAGGRAS